jgi:hypothetical protein
MEPDAAFVTVVVDYETDILPSPNPGTPKPPEIAGLLGRPGVRGAIEAVGDRCRGASRTTRHVATMKTWA